jgi:hypothetical protein
MNISPLKVATNTQIFEIESLTQLLGDATTGRMMVSIKNFYTDCRNLIPKVIAPDSQATDFLSMLYKQKELFSATNIPIAESPPPV